MVYFTKRRPIRFKERKNWSHWIISHVVHLSIKPPNKQMIFLNTSGICTPESSHCLVCRRYKGSLFSLNILLLKHRQMITELLWPELNITDLKNQCDFNKMAPSHREHLTQLIYSEKNFLDKLFQKMMMWIGHQGVI